MNIVVLGAGAWGTALAINAANCGHAVTLWARDADLVSAMQVQRHNPRYLPGCAFPVGLQLSAAPLEQLWLQGADVFIIATPMRALRSMLASWAAVPGAPQCPVAWLCKGFEAGESGLLAHEIHAQVCPQWPAGVLSGPSFAQEVAAAAPTALVAASAHASVRDALVQAFHGPHLRVYANDDVVGVEVGGAVKNVLAIATGLCDGLSLGLNARAALVTRGLAEMSRLGVALGGKSDTFMGLSGLGDLVLTATGDLSRNRQVGMALARGLSLDQAVAALGHVAEGVYSARTVWARAQQLGVSMPITHCVVRLLDGQLTPPQALAALMGREPTAE